MKNLTVIQHANISGIMTLAGFGIALIGSFLSNPLEPHFVLWLGIAVIGIALIYRVVFVRCPHCGDRFLGLRKFPEFCPQCGKKISE